MKIITGYILFCMLTVFCGSSFCVMPAHNKVPVFDSAVIDGIQFTIRLSGYDYTVDDPVLIECWLRNRKTSSQTVCIFPLDFTLFAKLEKDGKPVFDTEDGFVAGGDFAAGIGDKKPDKKDYFELKPDWSLRIEEEGRFVPLDMITGRMLKLSNQKITPGEYNLTLRFSQKVFSGGEYGIKSWTGTVDSNTVKLRVLPAQDSDVVLKQLNSPSATERARAAGMLGRMNEPRATEPLIALLKDGDAEVRLNAAAALGNIGNPVAVEPLTALLDDKDMLVVRYAIFSLTKSGDKRAVEPLIKKLSADSPLIKCDVLYALKIFSVPESASAIAMLLKDGKRSVRYTALHSLPTLLVTDPVKRKELAQSLIEATTDEYFQIRGDAATLLVEFSDTPEVADAIIKMLKDKNPYARLHAVYAIGEIMPAGAVEILTPLREDPDKEVREATEKIILKLEGDPDGINILNN